MILFCSHIESFSYFSSCSWNQSFVQFCREKYKKKNGYAYSLSSFSAACSISRVGSILSRYDLWIRRLITPSWKLSELDHPFANDFPVSFVFFFEMLQNGSPHSRFLPIASYCFLTTPSGVFLHWSTLAKIAGVDISLAPPEAVYSLRNRQSLPSECYIRPFMSGWLSWPYGILARSFSFRTQSRSGPLWWACWISVIVTMH